MAVTKCLLVSQTESTLFCHCGSGFFLYLLGARSIEHPLERTLAKKWLLCACIRLATFSAHEYLEGILRDTGSMALVLVSV